MPLVVKYAVNTKIKLSRAARKSEIKIFFLSRRRVAEPPTLLLALFFLHIPPLSPLFSPSPFVSAWASGPGRNAVNPLQRLHHQQQRPNGCPGVESKTAMLACARALGTV